MYFLATAGRRLSVSSKYQSKCGRRCRIADTPECNSSAHENPRGANPNRERYGEKPVRSICVADEETTSRVASQMLLEGKTHAVSNANEIEEIL
jgi:hypothetical protein